MYPGNVRTAQLDFGFRKHWLFAPFRPFFNALVNATSVSAEECAEWTLFALLDAAPEGKGFYSRSNHGEDYAREFVDTEAQKSLREKLFVHSVTETKAEELEISSD